VTDVAASAVGVEPIPAPNGMMANPATTSATTAYVPKVFKTCFNVFILINII
jgi:hypothetical protein